MFISGARLTVRRASAHHSAPLKCAQFSGVRYASVRLWGRDNETNSSRPGNTSPEKVHRWQRSIGKGLPQHRQIKATASHHCSPGGPAQTRNPDNAGRWGACGASGTLARCWWERRLARPLRRTVWRFLRKLSAPFPCDCCEDPVSKCSRVLRSWG